MKKIVLMLLCSFWCLVSCRSVKPIEVAQHVARDSLVARSVEHDSVWVENWYCIDHRADTVWVEQRVRECHYHLCHDTVRVVRADSVPVIKEVEVIRMEKPPLSWFDKLCRCSLVLMLLAVMGLCIRRRCSPW